jgi:undecaprenyl-diphosphatase
VAAGAAAVLVGVPLLAGATDVVESVEVGGWRWLGGALALALLARSALATAAMLTVDRRIAVGRIFGASMVADGASLLHGHIGWRRSAARFLERAGVLPDAARRAVDRFSAGSVVAAALVSAGTFVLAWAEGRLSGWQAPKAVVPAVLLGLGAWALVLTGQWLALRHGKGTEPGGAVESGPHVTSALRQELSRRRNADMAATSRRWGTQLAWSVLAVALEAATLASALHSVGADVPLLTTATLYAALHLLWSVLPVTGAPGAADITLLLALTSLGAPLAGACAGVVVFRLLTFWLPAALGALFSARLEHRLVT